eukprot:6869501-Prymnesium_polylepis.1
MQAVGAMGRMVPSLHVDTNNTGTYRCATVIAYLNDVRRTPNVPTAPPVPTKLHRLCRRGHQTVPTVPPCPSFHLYRRTHRTTRAAVPTTPTWDRPHRARLLPLLLTAPASLLPCRIT